MVQEMQSILDCTPPGSPRGSPQDCKYKNSENGVAEPPKTALLENPNPIQAFRPRIIYCPIYVFFTVIGGKFVAPLLQELSPKFTDSVIGMTLAGQYAIISCLAGWGGALADAEEMKLTTWGGGRLKVLSWGVFISALAFLGHNLPQHFSLNDLFLKSNAESTDDASEMVDFNFMWHILMRALFAVGTALMAPAMDGLSLSHLECIEGASQSDFGKERVFGAIWWGLGSLVAGIGIDWFGFIFLYALATISMMATFVAILFYQWGLRRDTTGSFSATSKSKEQDQRTLMQSGTRPDNHSGAGQNVVDKASDENYSTKDLFFLICRTGYGSSLMFFVFALSIGLSVVDNLAFIFFTFLGSSNTMNGCTVIFTVLMEIPLFYLAPKLLEQHGPGKLLLLAGACYVIRITGYTLVPKGHMGIVLVLESLHGISYAGSKTGSVDFVSRLMPKGYEASGQGILIVVQFTGVVVGLFFAGFIQQTLGPRVMYAVMGSIVLFGMAVLITAAKCCSVDPLLESSDKAKNNGEHSALLSQTESVLASYSAS